MFIPLKSAYFSYGARLSARWVVGTVSLSLLVLVAGQRMPPSSARRIQMIPNTYPPNWAFLSHCLKPDGPGGLLNTTLRQCHQNERPMFDRSSRVAIVGGGPSGILMAKLLHDRGFERLTLFEKEGRVGGKSKNLLLDDGEKVDLGTIFTANKYECVELLAAQVNMTERPLDPDGKTNRFVSADHVDMKAPKFAPTKEWVADYAFQKYGVDPAVYDLSLILNASAYVDLWNETMGSSEYMFPDEETVNFDALNQSFLSWLENNTLYALIPRLIITTSGAGYGNLETIPAYYGLMWNHPNFFGRGTESGLAALLEDFQTMFERILATTNTAIKLKAQIVKIDREAKGVEIHYVKKVSGRQRKTRERFDFLIMAAPMPTALKMLAKPTRDELELFASYNYRSLRYDIGYLESTGVVHEPFNIFSWMDRHDKQTDYHVASLNTDGDTEMYILAQDGIDGALTLARTGRIDAGIRTEDDRNFSLSAGILSISPSNVTAEKGRSLIKSDLDEYNMTMTFRHTEIWPDYFPWKNLTQIVAKKMPWRIYDAQGKKAFPKTWYIGSYVSFESVPDVLDYNIKLVNEKLCVESEGIKGKSGKSR